MPQKKICVQKTKELGILFWNNKETQKPILKAPQWNNLSNKIINIVFGL